jgi:hypothetical protein
MVNNHSSQVSAPVQPLQAAPPQRSGVFSIQLGLSDTRILEHHPDLSQADLDAAWAYYKEHPEEIDEAIRRNEEA